MSDFEDFEDLFDKEADSIQKSTLQQENASEYEIIEDEVIENEENEINYSKYTDNLELEEYLKRKINHLCINLSAPNLNNEYDINANTLNNLKQLKKGLSFDNKVLESKLIFKELYNNNILEHDLIKIINMYQSEKTSEYLMKCIFRVLEIIYNITCKIKISEDSSKNEIENYNHVKKIQLIYKKQLLNKKFLSKITKILIDMAFKFDENEFKNVGSNKNKTISFVINIIKNVLEIDLFDMIVSDDQYKKFKSNASRNSSISCLPVGLNKEDIGIKHVLHMFESSGLLTALLKLTQIISEDHKADYEKKLEQKTILLPLFEIWYSLIKDISPVRGSLDNTSKSSSKDNLLTRSNSSIQNLLLKDEALKKRIVNNTSSRHSKFGTLITVKTDKDKRTQLTNVNNRTLSDLSLDFLDDNKKDLPQYGVNYKDKGDHWLKSEYLNILVDDEQAMNLHFYDNPKFIDIIEKFILSKTYNNFTIKMLDVINFFKETPHEITDHSDIVIKFFIISSWFLEFYKSKLNSNDNKNLEKYKKLLVQYMNFKPRYFVGEIHGLYNEFTSESKKMNFCVIHSFNKFYNLILDLIMITPLDLITVYLIPTMYIYSSSDLFDKICSFPRLLDNSTNVHIKQSSFNLLNTLFKFKHEFNNLSLNKAQIEKSPMHKHSLLKNMKTQGIQDIDSMYSEIEYFLEGNKEDLKVFYKDVFHCDLMTALISYIENTNNLSYSSQKTLLRLLNICLKCYPVALQRIDLIINLRQWMNSLTKRDRLYPHIDQFSTKFLSQIIKRIKINPNSASLELLFVEKSKRLHYIYGDSSFIETGKASEELLEAKYCIQPSSFNDKFVSSISGLIRSESMKHQLGVIIGCLQEKNKDESVRAVLEHMKYVRDSVSTENNAAMEYDILRYLKKNEHTLHDDIVNKCGHDPDFRFFLNLISYKIPKYASDQKCILSLNDNQFTFNFFINLIENFLETPFELNWDEDISMNSLMIRPASYVESKKKTTKKKKKVEKSKSKDENFRRAEEYEKEDGFVDDAEDENDDTYFKQLSEKRERKKTIKKSSKISVAIFDDDNGLDDIEDIDLNIEETVASEQVGATTSKETEEQLLRRIVPTEKFVVEKIVEKPKTQSKISYDAAKAQMLKRSEMFKQQKRRILEDSEDEDEDELPEKKKNKTIDSE
ncbi:uncharacterized protein HGUI_01211 [Hanseniaspora guilliermondii]|uniref:Timeless N-terminal domain-containing protein n=1 Tax=Hanseniaspora guilliermondii TaxID=56406 RepID=A0A1L0B273_9ASCO|nr:uncharacterized protein HGUI_01211 [Hanseniaspora guilliermondii]